MPLRQRLPALAPEQPEVLKAKQMGLFFESRVTQPSGKLRVGLPFLPPLFPFPLDFPPLSPFAVLSSAGPGKVPSDL